MTPTRKSFLLSTLTGGATILARRTRALLAGLPFLPKVEKQPTLGGQPILAQGPFLGDVASARAKVWARFGSPGVYRLVVEGGLTRIETTAEASPENDHCVGWQLNGLEPEHRYRYQIWSGDQLIMEDASAYLETLPTQTEPAVTRLAIGSCAREGPDSRAVWRRMAAVDPDAILLLGDTPYIDTTDLAVQRRRYAEFAAVPEFADLLRNRPLYATWDDHDYGLNDSDGRLDGKENARRAFVEFHANPSYGDGDEGVYTKFRLGGAEIFLLDTRYFSRTESSPISDGPTLLGTRQWEWLRDGLRSSTAPFKILASGMIWNYAVRPGKPDHWDSYREEKEALFQFLGRERISGVVLMGGDVHRTRVLRYDTNDSVGYPLTELITSPIHDGGGAMVANNAPHPDLIHDSGEPHSFLLLTVDTTSSPSTLHARFENSAGREFYSLTLDTTTLSAD